MNENNKKTNDSLLGSLWVTVGEGGEEYIKGVLNGVQVKIVRNKNKKNDNSPDLFVFRVKGKGDSDVKF